MMKPATGIYRLGNALKMIILDGLRLALLMVL